MRIWKPVISAVAIAVALSAPASGQWVVNGDTAAPADIWDGGYLGLLGGYSIGTAHYTFNTDGWYNTAIGQTWVQPVSGLPMGVVLGYNWQNGRLVYGVEGAFITGFGGNAGAFNTPSPFFPASDEFDFESHWTVTFGPRIGFAHDRLLFYGTGGLAVGHLIAEARDNVNNDRLPWDQVRPGAFAGVGAEFVATRNIVLGLGYQYVWLAPMNVAGEAQFQDTGDPAGVFSDHTIRFHAHMITARVTLLLDPAAGIGAPLADDRFDGLFVGPIYRQWAGVQDAGIRVGYHFTHGMFVAGPVAQAGLAFGGGAALEAAARTGLVLGNAALVYGQAAIGSVGGAGYWGFTAGAELALTANVSVFAEVQGRTQFGSTDRDRGGAFGIVWYPGAR